MASDATVLLAYFGGVAMGVILTLWWQANAAAIRRQIWDFYSTLPEDHQ